MADPLTKTIQILTSSKGKASRRALNVALHSSEPRVCLLACQEVLAKNHSAGIFELIKNYSQLPQKQREFLAQNIEKLVSPIRTALLNEDLSVQNNAIIAVQDLRPYSLIPHLLRIFEQEPPSRYLGNVQAVVMFLTNEFSRKFNGTVPQIPAYGHILTEIIDTLQHGFCLWKKHERMIFFDVFFKLSDHMTNIGYEFRDMTSDPNHPAQLPLIRKLVDSPDPQVIRFLIRQLESISAPPGILSVAARRTDRLFVRMLLESIGYKPSLLYQENLSKIHKWEWLNHLRDWLPQQDAGYHCFVVALIRYSGLNELEKINLYAQILRYGKTPGKLALLEALRNNMESSNINRLVLQTADDSEPEVQAAALSQLRERNIKNWTAILLKYVDSPSPLVRETISRELIEFRMARFLKKFDQFLPEQQKFMFSVIRKVDPEFQEVMALELINPQQKHKDFLLQMISEEHLAVRFETPLIQFVEKENDVSLRLKGIKLLALGRLSASYHCLKRIADNDLDKETRALAQRICEIRSHILEHTG
ncbi:MAG: HEAT repeat domain-containing protein [Planctomycetaceae bacterium]|jgi:HEAT repeat protein|nr:HEAT repeat domain-containing protein [Planctomycetaceae bacterium]